MGNVNESMKVPKSALEEKEKIVSDYGERLDGPWNHLDLWHITWGNGLTCFSSHWLFVCLQEPIASLEGFERDKGITFSHDTYTCRQDIKKKRESFDEMGVLMRDYKFGIDNTLVDDDFMRRTAFLITLGIVMKKVEAALMADNNESVVVLFAHVFGT